MSTESPRTMSGWRLTGIVLLCVRFVQGWIYWGGGSRRFIYAPQKLNPDAPQWMANKFQTAMPGALLGMDHVVDYLLHHFYLLYAGVIVFSAVELFFGLFLIVGFMTRLSALMTMGLSFVLMLLFGWQGATCIDEWTMAACNFGMGATLLLGGAGAYSVDSWLAKSRPKTASKPWFTWLASGALPDKTVVTLGKVLLTVTVVFVVSTYHYYRGSVFTPFHPGPVSPAKHHVSMTDGRVLANGSVSFHAYLDGGTADVPAHIVRVELLGVDGKVVEVWNGAQLAVLGKSAFANDYRYNQFRAGFESIQAAVGSKATITLPAAMPNLRLGASGYSIAVTTIDALTFKTAAQLAP
ncbi:MAG: DoxX family membrane protein [Gammaproteobacteria bacterium]|nr:DoxX family membrane protein [Gammaproteobacteria bacterium]